MRCEVIEHAAAVSAACSYPLRQLLGLYPAHRRRAPLHYRTGMARQRRTCSPLIMPSAIGMVFAHPADAETNRAVLIHERAAPAPEIAGIPREATLSFMAQQNNSDF